MDVAHEDVHRAQNEDGGFEDGPTLLAAFEFVGPTMNGGTPHGASRVMRLE